MTPTNPRTIEKQGDTQNSITQISDSHTDCTEHTEDCIATLAAVGRTECNIPEVHASETMRALCSLRNLCETKDR